MSDPTGRAALDLDRIRDAIGTQWRVDVVAETTSTNADLLADPAGPDRVVLVAEAQTAGRGRFDRAWSSPPRAGLTFSLRLRPRPSPATWGWLPLLTGVALAEAVRDATGVETALKWPNDLLAGPTRRKAAGILAQSVDGAVVIGIGLNVTTTADELPVLTATSLALEGATAAREDVLAAALTHLGARLSGWTAAAGDAAACGLADAYREHCATLGQLVRVSTSDGGFEGDAVDIDADGRLVVRTSRGLRSVSAGDVEHVRPA